MERKGAYVGAAVVEPDGRTIKPGTGGSTTVGFGAANATTSTGQGHLSVVDPLTESTVSLTLPSTVTRTGNRADPSSAYGGGQPNHPHGIKKTLTAAGVVQGGKRNEDASVGLFNEFDL